MEALLQKKSKIVTVKFKMGLNLTEMDKNIIKMTRRISEESKPMNRLEKVMTGVSGTLGVLSIPTYISGMVSQDSQIVYISGAMAIGGMIGLAITSTNYLLRN